MRAVGIIPARWASSRFPGKVATEIAGRSMLEHVWRGARQCARLREVIVATDDRRILDLCTGFGARAVMTSPEHPTGTDRIAEVAEAFDDDVVVNIQGDEPLIEGFVIDAALDALVCEPAVPMSTLAHRMEAGEAEDPNRVKVVMDADGLALYFSRAPIPFARLPDEGAVFHQHVGLYAYTRDFLQRFVGLDRGVAEQTERLEQLRALEAGQRVRVGVVEGWRSAPVDVPADVARVEARLAARA